MKHGELLQLIKKLPKDPDDLFRLLRSVAYFHSSPDSRITESLDLIIRVLDKRSVIDRRLPGASAMLDAIAREVGLYPYMVKARSWQDDIALEIVRAPGLENVYFHIEQAKVFARLAAGESLILSAPTSFGKSLLVDTLIATTQPHTVVACVPTIALLDEFRRRMRRRFDHYQVITTSTQARDERLPAIFVGTQERLRERPDIGDVDLFVLDEFYKLDLGRGDERSISLNALLGSVGRRAKQIYLLGPSIDEVPDGSKFREDIHFYKSRYSPVTADIIDRSDVGASVENLIEDLKIENKSSNLIYVKSPPAAWQLTHQLLRRRKRRGTEFLIEFGKWLQEHYHPEWILGESLKKGIGIHHGRVPRSVAHLLVESFNREWLKILLCTSSMIEGVNTSAECVFIYDRKINTKKLDRFTFDNIKGRAGRLKKHAVGRIYLYDSPPETTSLEVDVPLFGDQSRYSNELLFQIEPNFLNAESKQRRDRIVSTSNVPEEIFERWSEFGVEAINSLAESFQVEEMTTDSGVFWQGFPEFNELEATFGLAWRHLRFSRHGLVSPRQAAYFAMALYRNRYWVRGFFEQLVQSKGLEAQAQIDLCFNFLRAAEYTLPQVLRALSDVAQAVVRRRTVDYTPYANLLQNLFLPNGLRALDELGIPIPIASKIVDVRNTQGVDPDETAEAWQGREFETLTGFENKLVQLSLG